MWIGIDGLPAFSPCHHCPHTAQAPRQPQYLFSSRLSPKHGSLERACGGKHYKVCCTVKGCFLKTLSGSMQIVAVEGALRALTGSMGVGRVAVGAIRHFKVLFSKKFEPVINTITWY
jgi:hypothetical protein